jgi:thioredoxin 1
MSMANANVKTFTDQNFQGDVLDSQVPVLVDFWAEWCGPCRSLSPTIDELATQFAGKLTVGKVDTDNNRDVPVKYGISAIPTVLLFKDGKVVKKFVGLQPKADFVAAIESVS